DRAARDLQPAARADPAGRPHAARSCRRSRYRHRACRRCLRPVRDREGDRVVTLLTSAHDRTPVIAPAPRPPAENWRPVPPFRHSAEDRNTISTYYDQPALKASPWGWKVSTYIFVSGLAGSAQIIATA